MEIGMAPTQDCFCAIWTETAVVDSVWEANTDLWSDLYTVAAIVHLVCQMHVFIYQFLNASYTVECLCVCVCRSEDYLQESGLSFHHVGPKNWAQVGKSGSKHLYLLSDLAGSTPTHFKVPFYLCVCVSTYVWVSMPMEASNVGVAGAGITSGCELSEMNAGKLTTSSEIALSVHNCWASFPVFCCITCLYKIYILLGLELERRFKTCMKSTI